MRLVYMTKFIPKKAPLLTGLEFYHSKEPPKTCFFQAGHEGTLNTSNKNLHNFILNLLLFLHLFQNW